jgi:hypothetical protein
MQKNFIVEAKLSLSKLFPPGSSEIKFGRYRLQSIPISSATEGEGLLSFVNTYKAPELSGSNPRDEINILCKLLSVFLDARIKRIGLSINAVNTYPIEAPERKAYPQFFGVLDATQLDYYITRVLSLDVDLARQFIRACHAYSFAIEFIPSDVTFAFFLLVVAIECMSSQDKVILYSELQPDKKKCERFCRFINSCLPDKYKGNDERNDELLNELLKTTYFSHRSGFVHGGKEVSDAAILADKSNSSYFKHIVDGKEVKTPGIGWFVKIVRGSLLGYLDSLSIQSLKTDEELLSRLAFEKGELKVKVRRTVKQGQIVTSDDIDYR